MEIKAWTYEEFPEFREIIQGAKILKTTGAETGIRYQRDVEYAVIDGTPLHLQILKPVSRNETNGTVPAKIYPCVVYVQGSAWMQQDVYADLPMLANLAMKGYVVACVEYRHSGIACFPAQIQDARNAVRFLRMNAEDYSIDPEKMILAGNSSGGHTAVFAGIMHDDHTAANLYPGVSGEVKGIVDYYGSVSVMMEDSNPSTVNHHLPDSPEGMEMGGVNLRERPDLCGQLSAECNITEDTKIAPVLIFHGTKDRIVNIRQSVRLYQRMKEIGKDVRLYLVEGADHGGPEFLTGEMCSIVDEFIQYCLKE